MNAIDNVTRCQIVINFYQKNQSKGKPYTIEYICKLNIIRHKVCCAIKRFKSDISHNQQLGTGRLILVMPNETTEIAFVADNPGKWLLHCHMLGHAASGMTNWIMVT